MGLLTGLGPASIAPAAGAGGGAGGIGGSGGDEPTGSRAYEKIAHRTYERGRRYVRRGLEIEKNAGEAPDPERRDELLGRARGEYGRALRQFDSALSRQSDLHEAHSDRGFVLRKLGDYEAALAAYDAALALEADFGPAIEYRGEAYLELGRLDDAKGAYLSLVGSERALADLLLEKMRAWVTRHREDPGAGDPGAVEAFAAWLEERARIADAIPAAEPASKDTAAASLRW